MTEEVRIVSETGGAKGSKLYRFDQIPAGPMRELAARYGIGAMKYEPVNGIDNWRNGYPFSLSIAALHRHLNAFMNGEDIDEEAYLGTDNESAYEEDGETPRPGTQHLAAVTWHCFFLLHHLEHNPQLDDRASTVLARNAETPERNEYDELTELVLVVQELAARLGLPITIQARREGNAA